MDAKGFWQAIGCRAIGAAVVTAQDSDGSENARIAIGSGADALVVSNHGGRQLDGAQASIDALSTIVDAIGDRIELMFDGGIRSGQDIVRALALGARWCLLGRVYVHGFGAGRKAGILKAIEILRKELDVSMALVGARTLSDVDRRILTSA